MATVREPTHPWAEQKMERTSRSRCCLIPSRVTRTFTIISVDDHLVEPRDLFDGRMPAVVRRRRAACHRERQRSGDVALRRRRSTRRSGSTRCRVVQGSVEHRARPLRRDAARAVGTSTRASPTWISTACTRRCAFRRCWPASPAQCSRRARTRTSASRACGRGTTGTSKSGPAVTPIASSRCRFRGSPTRRSRPTRSAATPSAASRP